MDKPSKRPDGMIVQIIISVISIAAGAVLLFVPQIQPTVLCYLFSAALILSGVIAIFRFFHAKGYTELHDYHFAEGVLFILLGCIGLIRPAAVIDNMPACIGFVTLLLGTAILQGMVQLKALDNSLWIVVLVFAALSLAASLLILGNVTSVMDHIPNFLLWAFMIAGILSLCSLLFVWIGIKRKRQTEKELHAEQDSE